MTNFTLKLTFNGENRFGVLRIRGMYQTRGLVVAFLEMLILRNTKEGRMKAGEGDYGFHFLLESYKYMQWVSNPLLSDPYRSYRKRSCHLSKRSLANLIFDVSGN